MALIGGASIRSASSNSRRLKASLAGSRNTDFLKLVERTEDAFTTSDDPAVEDVRRTLADVRAQYDQVHVQAEKREAELSRLKEAIRVADTAHSAGTDEASKEDDLRFQLEAQLKDTEARIKDAQTARKVYNHMLYRITKEQALLKEKLLKMELHLQRKTKEAYQKASMQERITRQKAKAAQDLEILENDVELERSVRRDACENMDNAIKATEEAKERRVQFELWRTDVAVDAAREAFNASAGRLRKLHAIEKLVGNSLQNMTSDMVERSQTTEEGFQRIREVTGLSDVMDIVHKFLNREVESEQLKTSVKEAEIRRETLKEQYDRFKRDTSGLTFDVDQPGISRSLYMEKEEHEDRLQQVLKEHEQSRIKLQQSTIQVEHMKRWANRMGRSLQPFESDCVKVDKPSDLVTYYTQMLRGVEKFITHIVQQINLGKVQRKNMSQVASKEYHEARRLLADTNFLKANCRVPPTTDAGRPNSGKGTDRAAEEQLVQDHLQDRERFKHASRERLEDAMRKLEHQKKKTASAN